MLDILQVVCYNNIRKLRKENGYEAKEKQKAYHF